MGRRRDLPSLCDGQTCQGHLGRPLSVNWRSMFEEDALKCTDKLWRSRAHHHRAVD